MQTFLPLWYYGDSAAAHKEKEFLEANSKEVLKLSMMHQYHVKQQ